MNTKVIPKNILGSSIMKKLSALSLALVMSVSGNVFAADAEGGSSLGGAAAGGATVIADSGSGDKKDDSSENKIETPQIGGIPVIIGVTAAAFIGYLMVTPTTNH
jgi:hypothetical protein